MRNAILALCGAFLILSIVAVISGSGDPPANTNSAENTPTSTAPPSLPVAPCAAADFSVSKTKAVVEYDEARLTGLVTNHCKSSAGIRLKWTAYNSDGTVAFSNDFWPASTTNIAPGQDYPFEMMNTAPRGKWTYTVEPLSVDIW